MLIDYIFNQTTFIYLSDESLSMRSRELVEASPGDELNKLSEAPFAVSDSELRKSILCWGEINSEI